MNYLSYILRLLLNFFQKNAKKPPMFPQSPGHRRPRCRGSVMVRVLASRGNGRAFESRAGNNFKRNFERSTGGQWISTLHIVDDSVMNKMESAMILQHRGF